MSPLRDVVGPGLGEMIGGMTTISELVLRTDRVAVSIDGVVSYPNHFRFRVVEAARTRHGLTDGGLESWNRLGLALKYSDGTEVVHRVGGSPKPGAAVLVREMGHGNDSLWQEDWLVTALPSDGPVVVRCIWHATEESGEVEIDGKAIRSAALLATPIWD